MIRLPLFGLEFDRARFRDLPWWFWIGVGCCLGLVIMGTICWLVG